MRSKQACRPVRIAVPNRAVGPSGQFTSTGASPVGTSQGDVVDAAVVGGATVVGGAIVVVMIGDELLVEGEVVAAEVTGTVVAVSGTVVAADVAGAVVPARSDDTPESPLHDTSNNVIAAAMAGARPVLMPSASASSAPLGPAEGPVLALAT